MSDLQIKQIDTAHLSSYESWFDNRSTLNMLFKRPEGSGLAGLSNKAWAGTIDDEVVAVSFYSLDTMHHGHIYLAVKPSERRHGYGTEMMKKVLTEPLVTGLSSHRVTVEPENEAAQKILRRTGFFQTGSSPEGLFEFERL